MMAFQTSPELPESLKDKKKMIFGYIKALHTFHDGYALLECACMYGVLFLSVHVCTYGVLFLSVHVRM